MIYLFRKLETEDGNYAELLQLNSTHINDAKNEVKRMLNKEAEDWGSFENKISRLQKMSKEWTEAKLLDVMESEPIDINKILHSLIKEAQEEVRNANEARERREYERLKAKFGDK